jgi:hypothetical protein
MVVGRRQRRCDATERAAAADARRGARVAAVGGQSRAQQADPDAQRADQEGAARATDRNGSGHLTAEQAEPLARDRVLLEKRRQLADAFKGYPDVDRVAIKKLQAEIRWFAPGAYATESAFAYAVKYGQVRKEAGKAAAKASGGGQPTTSQVLAELNPNLDEERWVSPAERSSRLANAANANIGKLGRHPHGAEPKAQAKDAAKYAGRVLEAAETMGGPVKHGPMEDALRSSSRASGPTARRSCAIVRSPAGLRRCSTARASPATRTGA